MKMITLDANVFSDLTHETPERSAWFACWDNNEVFTMLRGNATLSAVPGHLYLQEGRVFPDVAACGNSSDHLRIVVCREATSTMRPHWPENLRGYVRSDTGWEEAEIQVIPAEENLYSRHEGLIETAVLADKRVLGIGVGSLNSLSVLELGKAGVSNFKIWDMDRIEHANVVRHLAGLSQIGRYKVHFMADALRDKNPYVNVEARPLRVCTDTLDKLREDIRASDLVVCCVDEREARGFINRLCVEEKKTCIIGGAFRRAYGGRVFVYHPDNGPCMRCVLDQMGINEEDEEISRPAQAQRIAYSDRPVPIEPGLSTDILPLSLMMTKIALTELLRDRATTLRSLEADFSAPSYLWLNRREAGTTYEDLKPLGSQMDTMTILRWYSLDFDPNPACPVCGDFVGEMIRRYGLPQNADDEQVFCQEGDIT